MQLDSQGMALLSYLNNHLVNVVPGNPRTYVSYKRIHDEMRLPLKGPTYGQSLINQGLDNLANWSHAKNLPGISGLIIGESSFQPGEGYFRLFDRDEDDFRWWEEQVYLTKLHDWSQYLVVNMTTNLRGFESWLLKNKKSVKTAKNYTGAISGSLTKWAQEAKIIDHPLTEERYSQNILDVKEKLNSVEIYIQRNEKGGNMYSCALKAYAGYLRELTSDNIEEDLSNIKNDDQVNDTDKTTLINARVGQGQYRKKLIQYWNGCALTGYKDTRLLIASHIKPWRESNNLERLDPFNGLMLMPNLDKAFDLGFITFKEQGDLIISAALETPEMLGVSNTMKLDLNDKHKEYMTYHRDIVFKT